MGGTVQYNGIDMRLAICGVLPYTESMQSDRTNPRVQCSKCGRWMRLSGTDENGHHFQRFYSCYTRQDGSIGYFKNKAPSDVDGGEDWCNDCIHQIPDAMSYRSVAC